MHIKAYRPSNVPEYYLKNVPKSENVIKAMPFSFSSIFAPLAGPSSTQQIIQTLSDSDFVCISLQSDNVNVNPSIIIRDAATNWPFMNAPVPIVSIFGTGSLPYFLPVPWYFSNKTSIELTVTTTPAVLTGFTLTLSGIRLFRK